MDIAGRVALVTGAGTGIGRATAMALAQAGAAVVAVDIHLAGAQGTVDTIVAAGGRATAVQADVSDPADPHRPSLAVRGCGAHSRDLQRAVVPHPARPARLNPAAR